MDNNEPIKTMGRTKGLKRPNGVNYSEEEKDIVYTAIINEMLENPNTSITNILKANENYPVVSTFFNWIDSTPERQKQYARAQEVKAHSFFNELLTTAKGADSDNDTVVKVQRDRLVTDTIKFYIAKVLPKVYGEKVDITSGGEAINVVSLGVGIAPKEDTVDYIDITEQPKQIDSK